MLSQAEKEWPETGVSTRGDKALSNHVSRLCLWQSHGPEQKSPGKIPVLRGIQGSVKMAFQTNGVAVGGKKCWMG